MNRTRTLGFLLATLIVAACGSPTVPAQAGPAAVGASTSSDPCADAGDWAGTICPNAIALANARLGWLHWPVTSTTFRADLCPPGARCRASAIAGWVIFTFTTGDPVMIRVAPLDENSTLVGELVAGDPEPLPDWLLEEMATAPR